MRPENLPDKPTFGHLVFHDTAASISSDILVRVPIHENGVNKLID